MRGGGGADGQIIQYDGVSAFSFITNYRLVTMQTFYIYNMHAGTDLFTGIFGDYSHIHVYYTHI